MFPLMLVLMQISSTQATTIHHQKVVRIDAPSSAIKSKITHFEVASGIGAATVALDASVAGKLIHVFPVRDLGTMDEKMKSDPNYPFKQVNVPLFPLTNRLMPANYTSAMKLKKGDEFTAEVEGIKVKMPLNNVAAVSGAIPHHLHGLVFDQEAKKTDLVQNTSTAKVISTFEHFFRNFWTADARLTVEQSIEKGVFHYQLTAVNTGTTAMPVGFGSHPYFQMPSGSATGVKLRIPATQLADIDNLSNVLPTGTLSPLTVNDGRLNFSEAKSLPSGVIDNYFVLDPAQKKEVELVDTVAKVRYRFTAGSTNIVGVQVYYPGEGSVIAIEFVTHHPDPRQELWKTVATGMQVLKPGESATYSYQIAVESL